jgi:hypothetical protein
MGTYGIIMGISWEYHGNIMGIYEHIVEHNISMGICANLLAIIFIPIAF